MPDSRTTEPERLDGLVAWRASTAPHAPALLDGDQRATYRELDAAVTELAGALAAAGVRAGDRVGILLPRSFAAVVAVYAVLRAGAVAAPLDVTDPAARLARMAHGAGLDFLLAGEDTGATADQVRALASDTARDAGTSAHLDGAANLDGTGWADGTDVHSLPGGVLPGGVALRRLGTARPSGRDRAGGYLLFTSGSTGWPKGVLLSHGNVLHFVRWAVRALGVGPADRIGGQASLTFDLSTFDIFGAAQAGACLALMPDYMKIFPRDAVGWLAQARVSVFYAVPTLYRALVESGGADAARLPDLRVIAFAGEPFPTGALERCVRAFPSTRFVNLYGPTETNVCTWTELPAGWRASDGLSVGQAVEGLQVELVDGEGRAGAAAGEIAVAGPAVFQGYLVDGELVDPTVAIIFGDGVRRRAYLTGDLAHVDEAGLLWLHGRRDHQVKVRGHRIDLADVETAVADVPGVRACAVVAVTGNSGAATDDTDVTLRAYVITDGLAEGDVRGALGAVLPRRMIPDEIRLVAELPLNARGKVDRSALSART